MDWKSEFDRCRPWLEAALEYNGGTHSLEDIETAIAEGKAQLWPGQRSAIVTEMIQHPRATDLIFFLAGGELDELREMTPVIEEWAKEQGCSRTILYGRRGWDRTFLTKERGYKPDCWVLAKEI